MEKLLDIKSVVDVDMLSSFQLNVFATQDLEKIIKAFKADVFRGEDYEVPYLGNDLVPGHFYYNSETGGRLDLAGKFIDPSFKGKPKTVFNFGDWLTHDHAGNIKLYLLSWDKKYLVIIDRFRVISWSDGTSGPGTSILAHSFRLVKEPGKVETSYKIAKLRVDGLPFFMNWKRFSNETTFPGKDDGYDMPSEYNWDDETVNLGFKRIHRSQKYYVTFEGQPLKVEIKSEAKGNFSELRRIHQQDVFVKFETYIQAVSMNDEKGALFYDRFGRQFAVLLSILMTENLKLRQNILGVYVPFAELQQVQNFSFQNFKGYEYGKDVSIAAVQHAEIGEFQDLLLRWSSDEKLRALGTTLVNVWDEKLSVGVRLKELVSAIEIYHRDDYKIVTTKTGTEQKKSLGAREAVERLINAIGENQEMTLIIGDVEAFANKVVNYRILFTHGTYKEGMPEDAGEFDVLLETMNLEIIIRAFILDKLGLETELVMEVIGRQWRE